MMVAIGCPQIGQRRGFFECFDPSGLLLGHGIATAGDFAILSGGIEAGDRVVVDGQLRLRQGSKVQIKAMADTARLGAL
jgi:hypothetical protein